MEPEWEFAMEKDLEAVKKRIFRAAGRTFSITSNPQKVEVLTELGVNITAKTKKGAKGADTNQSMFVFATEESIRRGIFGNTPLTFRDGEDVDVPTYIRRSVRLTPAS
jgi:hypothetical protein